MNKNLIKYIYLLFSFLFVSCGCCKKTQVPIQTIDKIIYRDTVIYIHDRIYITVPYEKVKEVVPVMDTSCLKTQISESVAYVDTAKRKLYHTLTQKGYLKAEIDTIIKLNYVDRIVEKDVPVKVEVVKYKRDALFWVLVI